MKYSKLVRFKKNELKTKVQANTESKFGGARDGEKEATWKYCKEGTSGGSDALFEKWPDEGGAVIQTYVY